MTGIRPGASHVLAPGPRSAPHRFNPDPDAPGTCRCRLIKANRVHSEEALAAAVASADDAQAEERRRLGERED